MTRPPFRTYLIGNAASALAISIGSCAVVYQWWHGQTGDVAPVVAVVATIAAFNANQRITEYSNWKRAWDTMAGVSSGGGRAWRWLGRAIGLAIWTVLALGLAGADRRVPGIQAATVSFVLGTLLMVACGLVGWRRKRPAPPRRDPADIPVEVSPSVPRQRRGAGADAGLPSYCNGIVSGRTPPEGS